MSYLIQRLDGFNTTYGADYANLTGGTKKLYIRTATNGVLTYPLTTDTSASQYCKFKIKIGNSTAYLAKSKSSSYTSTNSKNTTISMVSTTFWSSTSNSNTGIGIYNTASTFNDWGTYVTYLLRSHASGQGKQTLIDVEHTSDFNVHFFQTQLGKTMQKFSKSRTTTGTTNSNSYIITSLGLTTLFAGAWDVQGATTQTFNKTTYLSVQGRPIRVDQTSLTLTSYSSETVTRRYSVPATRWTNSLSRASTYTSTWSTVNPSGGIMMSQVSSSKSTTISGRQTTSIFQYTTQQESFAVIDSTYIIPEYLTTSPDGPINLLQSYSLTRSSRSYLTRSSGYTQSSTNSVGASHTLSSSSTRVTRTALVSNSGTVTKATTFNQHTTASTKGTFVSKGTTPYSQTKTSSGTGTLGPVLQAKKPKVGHTESQTSWQAAVTASDTSGGSTSYYTRRTKRSEKSSTTKSATWNAPAMPYALSLKSSYSQTRFGTSSIRASRWTYATKTQSTQSFTGSFSTWKNSLSRVSGYNGSWSLSWNVTSSKTTTYRYYTFSKTTTRVSNYTTWNYSSSGTTLSSTTVTSMHEMTTDLVTYYSFSTYRALWGPPFSIIATTEITFKNYTYSTWTNASSTHNINI